MEELSWEEIAANIARLQAIHERIQDARPPGTSYLNDMHLVNQALQAGAQLRIDVAAHGLVTPLREAHVLHPLPQRESCVLLLQKVRVTFQQDGAPDDLTPSSKAYRLTVSLVWRDITHACNQVWGAILPQPQWEDIVQQAQTFLREHSDLSEEK